MKNLLMIGFLVLLGLMMPGMDQKNNFNPRERMENPREREMNIGGMFEIQGLDNRQREELRKWMNEAPDFVKERTGMIFEILSNPMQMERGDWGREEMGFEFSFGSGDWDDARRRISEMVRGVGERLRGMAEMERGDWGRENHQNKGMDKKGWDKGMDKKGWDKGMDKKGWDKGMDKKKKMGNTKNQNPNLEKKMTEAWGIMEKLKRWTQENPKANKEKMSWAKKKYAGLAKWMEETKMKWGQSEKKVEKGKNTPKIQPKEKQPEKKSSGNDWFYRAD